jgi:glycolate oxidase iron-sulfur subunit
MDSPRGRIFLMKSALEGSLEISDTLPYIDRCLGCMGCLTACPAGVKYDELLTPYRALAEETRSRPATAQLARTLTRETLPHPTRFRLAATAGRLAAPFKSLLPNELGTMLDMLPGSLPPTAQPLPAIYPTQGQRRARVALLSGCVQTVLSPNINWATLRVLARNGVEVVIPQEQGCCGSLMMHGGDAKTARQLARQNLNAFPADVDAVITNAAGCGSGMKEYSHWFKGQPDEDVATALGSKVKDISEFLDELGIEPPVIDQPLKMAYHDACHLAHAQGIQAAPRRLLSQIPGLTLLDIPEGELCCGSAGTYNLEQPALAASLGQRKARNILSTGAQAVVTGNIGCLVQIGKYLQQANQPLPLLHTVELLDQAYGSSTA